jgi:hypothetical protein
MELRVNQISVQVWSFPVYLLLAVPLAHSCLQAALNWETLFYIAMTHQLVSPNQI